MFTISTSAYRDLYERNIEFLVEIYMIRHNISSVVLLCRVIDTAASQLTKTAITVTAIFIVVIGYDSWYFMLGYAGAIHTYTTPQYR